MLKRQNMFMNPQLTLHRKHKFLARMVMRQTAPSETLRTYNKLNFSNFLAAALKVKYSVENYQPLDKVWLLRNVLSKERKFLTILIWKLKFSVACLKSFKLVLDSSTPIQWTTGFSLGKKVSKISRRKSSTSQERQLKVDIYRTISKVQQANLLLI